MQKVDDLDRTLENKLLNATPLSVPQPFDPACIEFGEYIHFRNGDIVNSLEDHNHADISYSFEVSEVERILEMLFDKKNLDISDLSEKDFEIAFLKLSKEKQRAMLHGMGLSNAQIDSILATEQSRRAFANTVFKSGAMDKIRKMDSKMPQYNNFGKPKDKTGGSKEKAPIPSAQSSSGVVECDSSSIYTPYKLDPSSYESLYNDYAEAANMLCDDDPSNDADAIALMNEALQKGFYVQERDGVNYIMYDTDLLQYCIDNAEEGSLLYLLFDDFRNKIGDGTLSTYEGHAWSKEHSLEISQLGAGYQLVLNVDSKFGFWSQEIKDKRVAYAATEATARNYLGSEGCWNWENIDEWLQSEVIDYQSVEYIYFAKSMIDMSDRELEHIIVKGQIDVSEGLEDCHIPGNTLQIIAVNYRKATSDIYKLGVYQKEMTSIPAGMVIVNLDDAKMQEARALAFYQAVESIKASGGYYYHDVEFSVVTKEKIGDVYEVKLIASPKCGNSGDPVWDYDPDASSMNKNIIVYPRGCDIDYIGDDVAKGVMWSLVSPSASLLYGETDIDNVAFAVSSYVVQKYLGQGDPSGLYFDILSYLGECEKAEKVNGASASLDVGNIARSMCMDGVIVYVDGEAVFVANEDFDRNELIIRTAAYNTNNGKSISIDSLIASYHEGGEAFDKYYEWYLEKDTADEITYFRDAVSFAANLCGYENVSDLSDEKLVQMMNTVMTVLQDRGETAVCKENYAEVCNSIKEIV